MVEVDENDLVRLGAWKLVQTLPERIEAYPSMLSQDERRMLFWLARDRFDNSGCICDLGSFLGGSTISLAAGAGAAGRPGKVVHSYDRHRITESAWSKWGLAEEAPFPEEGNFLPLMPQFLGEHVAMVEFHSGDFPELPPPDGSIEILFVDIAKTKSTSDHIVKNFFPKLIPGKSIVIQQDYFHMWPFLDIYAMEVLSDYFEPLSHVDKSALFLNTRSLDSAALELALSKNVTPALLRDTLRAASARWTGAQRETVLGIAARTEGLEEVPDTKQDFIRLSGGKSKAGSESRLALRRRRRARRASRRAAATDA